MRPGTLGYYTGSRWLSAAVAVALIGALAVALLGALEEAEERAEAVLVEVTVRNMRTGLQIAMGEAITHGREKEIAGWAGSNPVRWLGTDPVGYLGDCPGGSLPPGAWCFDRERRELAYQPRHHRHLVRVEGTELRWRVAAAAADAPRGGLVGLRLETVRPYDWFPAYEKSNK